MNTPSCGKIWLMRALETATSVRFRASRQFFSVLNAKFSSFLLFQLEIILVKCCKEVSAPLKLVFFKVIKTV